MFQSVPIHNENKEYYRHHSLHHLTLVLGKFLSLTCFLKFLKTSQRFLTNLKKSSLDLGHHTEIERII